MVATTFLSPQCPVSAFARGTAASSTARFVQDSTLKLSLRSRREWRTQTSRAEHKQRALSTFASISSPVEGSSSTTSDFTPAERTLLDAVAGVKGRGLGISSAQQEAIDSAVAALEGDGGISDPVASTLIEGRWQLLFTTRPGTASPIQRTFVGIDAFKIFQDVMLRPSPDARICNTVFFSEAIGELKVEAAASEDGGKRIDFQFDRAAFEFKVLPFKVPYPVPFRLLGDKAKGWLDTTYLSPSGRIRVSRGNKGTTFVLQKIDDAPTPQ